MPWRDGELLGFDLETTGTDRFSDLPVSYALVTVHGGKVISRRSSLVDPGCEIPSGAIAVHGITTERVRAEGQSLAEAVLLLSEAVVSASRREVPVVGMRLDFDLTILDVQSRRLQRAGLHEMGWLGPALDASVLDRRFDRYRRGRRTLVDLCDHYHVALGHAHDAGADALAAIAVLRAMCHRFPLLAQAAPRSVHRAQIGWHRAWAQGYDRWRARQCLPRLARSDFTWPIASQLVEISPSVA